MLQQREALLCGNACEPSSVKPSSFMYMEEDEITAVNKGFYACLCPFFIILYPVGCEAFPTDFGWMTEGSSHNLKTDFFSSSQTEMQFSWIKTSRQKTQTTAFTITTFYFIRSRRVWRKKRHLKWHEVLGVQCSNYHSGDICPQIFMKERISSALEGLKPLKGPDSVWWMMWY